MYYTMNIGLHSAVLGNLDPQRALSALYRAEFIVLAHAVHQSSTEPTLVAVVYNRGSHDIEPRVYELAQSLGQECIAYCDSARVGKVVGPEPWGEFDPSQFVLLNGARLSECGVVL